MPYKDAEKRKEYMREYRTPYMRKYRKSHGAQLTEYQKQYRSLKKAEIDALQRSWTSAAKTQEEKTGKAETILSNFLVEPRNVIEKLEIQSRELERYQVEEIRTALSKQPCPNCVAALQLQTQMLYQRDEIDRLKRRLAEKEADLKKVLRLISYDRLDLDQLKPRQIEHE